MFIFNPTLESLGLRFIGRSVSANLAWRDSYSSVVATPAQNGRACLKQSSLIQQGEDQNEGKHFVNYHLAAFAPLTDLSSDG